MVINCYECKKNPVKSSFNINTCRNDSNAYYSFCLPLLVIELKNEAFIDIYSHFAQFILTFSLPTLHVCIGSELDVCVNTVK